MGFRVWGLEFRVEGLGFRVPLNSRLESNKEEEEKVQG